MNYGTAGFRSNFNDIVKISFYVGFIISLMCQKYKKNYGIMITASHNEHNDNGLKIVNNYGHMISKEEEDEIINYLLNNEKTDNIIIDKNNNYKIFIGRDTRKSSITIFNEIEKGNFVPCYLENLYFRDKYFKIFIYHHKEEDIEIIKNKTYNHFCRSFSLG